MRREVRDLRTDWEEQLAKLAKVGARLAAQARRDLERAAASGEGTAPEVVTTPDTSAASRSDRKRQLRERARALRR